MYKRSFIFFLLSFFLLAGNPKAQNKLTKTGIEEYLNKKYEECIKYNERKVYIDSIEIYDVNHDGKEDAIVTASSCATGNGGPDIHTVLTKDSLGNIKELNINYGPNTIYDNLVGNRNYYLSHDDNFLIADFYDVSGRKHPLIVYFRWNNKEFIIAKVVKSKRFKTSFNCANAKTDVEKSICGNPELAALDLKLDSLYTAILSKLPKNRKEKLKNEQKEWIMERDDYCNTSRLVAGCLLDMYTKRINFLTKLNKVKD